MTLKMLTEAGRKLVDGIAWPSVLGLLIPLVWLGSGKRSIWFDGGLVGTIVYLIIIIVVLLPLCGAYILRIMMAPDLECIHDAQGLCDKDVRTSQTD
jgi:hypothetical protein